MLIMPCTAKNIIIQNIFITLTEHKKENNSSHSQKSSLYKVTVVLE